MDNKKKNIQMCQGRLPAMAPLANPYVPFQLEDPPKYEGRKALIRGTLFPGLDLPFMGMVNQKEKPITPKTELQVMAFALQELACIWTRIPMIRKLWSFTELISACFIRAKWNTPKSAVR